jgi:hypothetical protein
MLLRGWTAFPWLASGMCLAPHKPHHLLKRWDMWKEGWLLCHSPSPSWHLGGCQEKTFWTAHFTGGDVHRLSQCPQNEQEMHTLLLCCFWEATTAHSQFFYWTVWLHLPELWRSQIFASELRPQLQFYPFPLTILKNSVHRFQIMLLFFRIP